MITGKEGKIIVSPLSGVIVVRAMPDRQREVQAFLHHLTNGLERQVILEAKILEVQLYSGFQAGTLAHSSFCGQCRGVTKM